MNKIYRVAGATLMGVLLLLTLGSCSRETQLTSEAQPEAGAGQLAFSLGNDALRSVPAEAFEKAVDPDRVWCIFFTRSSSGALTFRVAKQAHQSSSGSNYSVIAGFSGSAQMFVIGNVEPELQNQFYRLTSGTPLDEVQRLLVKSGLGSGSTEPDHFVMTSDIVEVTLPARGMPATSPLQPIQLKRLAARFDVINEVPGLTLTTVTVANRIVTSTLLDMHETRAKASASTEYMVEGGKVLQHKIYSYQNSNEGGLASATTFTLRGKYNGKEINPIKLELIKKTPGARPFEVKRNYCYRILIKPSNSNDKPISPDEEPKTAWRIVVKAIDWSKVIDLANYSDEELITLGGGNKDIRQFVNPLGVNLLDAVAEYNLDTSGTKFVTTHSNALGVSGRFHWPDAMALKMPEGYHMPTANEWLSIIGATKSNKCINPSKRYIKKDISLTVQIPGQLGTIICKQDVKNIMEKGEYATYMIRYKDNDTYRSAWRYAFNEATFPGEEKRPMFKIEVVPVKAGLTVEDLNKEFFEMPEVKRYLKTIYLPICTPETISLDKYASRGVIGYWTATNFDDYQVYWVSVSHSPHVRDTLGWISNNRNLRVCVVRPFHNSWQGTQR